MSIKSAFDSRIYYDNNVYDQLSEALKKEIYGMDPIVCFMPVFIYVHRKVDQMLSCNIPNNWAIISLDSGRNFESKKCEFYRIHSLTKLTGFFIKRSMIPLILNKLPRLDILTAINEVIFDKISYAFYESLIYKFDISTSNVCYPSDIKFYSYIDPNVIPCPETLEETINYVIKHNISIRHHLSSFTKYIKPFDLVEILDFKLGLIPTFVTELINLASTDIPYDQIDTYLQSYLTTKPKKINSNCKFVNKDIINKFCDKYIYCSLPMCIVIPSYNNIKWYSHNLDSVFKQKYLNYRIIYVDDQSDDGTYEAVRSYVTLHQMWNRFTLIRQSKRNYQACSRYVAYVMADDDEIVCNLDGDDWLYDRDGIYQYRALEYVEEAYLKGFKSTYGCFYKSSGPQWLETTTVYTPDVIKEKSYRNSKYLCKHLRTGYASLYKRINITDILDTENGFIRMSTDLFTQYPVLEMSGDLHCNLLKPTYIYNQDNSVLYSNSWYNLNNPDNQYNLTYYETLQIKLKEITPYSTMDHIVWSPYHSFNWMGETLEVVYLGSDIIGCLNSDITYLNSKINHEIQPYMKINLQVITNISNYQSNDHSIILFINNYPNIISNLNPLPYLKLMLETRINHLLLHQYNVEDKPIPLTPDDMSYTINLTFNLEPIPLSQSSGFYTMELFEELINNRQLNKPHSLVLQSKPIITYLIPIYQTPLNWVRECLESLIKQSTQNNFRLLVSNDSSPDLAYVRELYKYLWGLYNHHFGNRIQITSTKKNLGLAGNNRYMIGITHTQIIGLIDSDDIIIPETTEQILHAYTPNVDFVYSNFYYCDDKLQINSPGYSKNVPLNQTILEANCISHLKTFRTASYYRTLGYDPTFKSAEDKDIIFKFEESHMKFVHIPTKLYKYRKTTNSLSRKSPLTLNDLTVQYTIDAIRDTYYRRETKPPLYQIWPKYNINPNQSTYQTYFNNYFDQIYVINLQSQTQNLQNMILRLKLIGAQNVTIIRPPHAKDIPKLRDLYDYILSQPLTTTLELREESKLIKTIGELGCVESHLMCLVDADQRQYRKILILEDDVYFDKHFLIKFKEYTLSIKEWLYLMLGSSQWSWWGNAPFVSCHTYHPTRASMGTFALGIDRDLIPSIFNTLSMYTGPADLCGYIQAILPLKPTEHKHSINYIYENRSSIDKCFVLYPNLVIPDTRKSDIRSNTDSDMEWSKRSKQMDWKLKEKNIVNSTYEIPHTYTMIEINDLDDMYPQNDDSENVIIYIPDLTPYDIHQLRLLNSNTKFKINREIGGDYYFHRMNGLFV